MYIVDYLFYHCIKSLPIIIDNKSAVKTPYTYNYPTNTHIYIVYSILLILNEMAHDSVVYHIKEAAKWIVNHSTPPEDVVWVQLSC